jgi:hypothetical protein
MKSIKPIAGLNEAQTLDLLILMENGYNVNAAKKYCDFIGKSKDKASNLTNAFTTIRMYYLNYNKL